MFNGQYDDTLYLLLPLSLLFVLAIGVSLWWAVFNGQYDRQRRHGHPARRRQRAGQGGRRRSVSAPGPEIRRRRYV